MFPVSPPIILAVVIASIYAALFNLWRNGTPRDLLFYVIAAGVGFALGQAAGWLLHLNRGMIGSLYLIEGTVLCWLTLFLMNWLRMPKEIEKQD
jgi:hypothetical protein